MLDLIEREKRFEKRDALLLVFFVIITATIVSYVAHRIVIISDTKGIACLIMAIAVLNIIAVTWAALEVFLHIRRNAKRIYPDDIKLLDLMAKQRGAGA